MIRCIFSVTTLANIETEDIIVLLECLLILSYLAEHYPTFPSMGDFLNAVLASPNTGDEENPLYALSQFALEYSHLCAGEAVLPDLIHLYWWIHTDLAYRVTRRYAERHTIGEVISRADKHTDVEVSQLYDRVRGMCVSHSRFQIV